MRTREQSRIEARIRMGWSPDKAASQPPRPTTTRLHKRLTGEAASRAKASIDRYVIEHPSGHWEFKASSKRKTTTESDPVIRIAWRPDIRLTGRQAIWATYRGDIHPGDRHKAGCGKDWCVNPRHLKIFGRHSRVRIKGKTRTLEEWSSVAGVNLEVIFRRIRKGISGAGIIQTTAEARRKNAKKIRIAGATKTIQEWCKHAGISQRTFRLRYARGERGKTLIEPRRKK